MALQSSGAISLSDIQGEFGGSNPISISEYYGKDTVPSSGAIDFSDFYGTSDGVPDLQAIYASTQAENFTSAGISWKLNNRYSGYSGSPSKGGYVSLAGSGTYPCVYASSLSQATGYQNTFAQRDFLALDGVFQTSTTTSTLVSMNADSRPNEYLIYWTVNLITGNTGATQYKTGVDNRTLDARIDWYS